MPHASYPKQSVDLLEIIVTSGGARITDDLEAALVPKGTDRSTAVFSDCETVDGRFGMVLPGTLEAGQYEVWAKFTDVTLRPWIPCGTVELY